MRMIEGGPIMFERYVSRTRLCFHKRKKVFAENVAEKSLYAGSCK